MDIYSNTTRLVLASGSPRRKELLASLGFEFRIQVPEIDESPRPNEMPRPFAQRLATEKAEAIPNAPKTVLIAADTIVVLNGHILGKPTDEDHAAEMLANLSGQTHEVITGVCIKGNDRTLCFSVVTQVDFRTITPEEIVAYIATGCPMDKAGSYAIQGGAAHMVREIRGSYTNVIGLPLCEVHEALISF